MRNRIRWPERLVDMHELGIAQGILDLVREHVPDTRAPAVHTVTVRVGALAGVVVDSLEFCFGAIVAGTPFRRAVLAIEPVPARGRCQACDAEFAIEGLLFVCRACGDPHVRLTAGTELQVVAVDLDEAQAEAS